MVVASSGVQLLSLGCRQMSWTSAAKLTTLVLSGGVLLPFLLALSASTCWALDTDIPGSASGDLLAIKMSQVPGGESSSYYLQVSGDKMGGIYLLEFCPEVTIDEMLLNGHAVIMYDKIVGGVMYTCQPPRLDQDQKRRRRQLFETLTTPTRPSYIVYITTLCGYNKSTGVDKQDVHELFFGSGDQRGRNMLGYYDTCSYGRVRPDPNVVVLVPVEIPCNGSLDLPFSFPSGNSYDSRTCSVTNFLKWQYYVDTVAAKQGINTKDFNHKVMIFPQNAITAHLKDCLPFSGLSSVGWWDRTGSPVNPYGSGMMWLPLESFYQLEFWLHEAGHNLFMAHANTREGCSPMYDGQCDWTCTMGAQGGQGIRCLNAPHNWQLGWGRPFQWYDANVLRYAKYVTVQLPPQMTTPNSSVVLSLNGPQSSDALYLSARINTPPYDLPFDAKYNGVPFLLLHSYAGTESNVYFKTVLQDSARLLDVVLEPVSGLVAYFKAWSSQDGASVILCRRLAATERTCGDGLDDDCDFLTDEEDPDCIGRTGPNADTGPQRDTGNSNNTDSSNLYAQPTASGRRSPLVRLLPPKPLPPRPLPPSPLPPSPPSPSPPLPSPRPPSPTPPSPPSPPFKRSPPPPVRSPPPPVRSPPPAPRPSPPRPSPPRPSPPRPSPPRPSPPRPPPSPPPPDTWPPRRPPPQHPRHPITPTPDAPAPSPHPFLPSHHPANLPSWGPANPSPLSSPSLKSSASYPPSYPLPHPQVPMALSPLTPSRDAPSQRLSPQLPSSQPAPLAPLDSPPPPPPPSPPPPDPVAALISQDPPPPTPPPGSPPPTPEHPSSPIIKSSPPPRTVPQVLQSPPLYRPPPCPRPPRPPPSPHKPGQPPRLFPPSHPPRPPRP